MKVNGNVFYGKGPPDENRLSPFVRSIIINNYYDTEVAQLVTPSCSRPQPATYDGVRDSRSYIDQPLPPPFIGQYP